MTAKVGRSQWDSHLINQYRQERNEARAENERLKAELDLALEKLRAALAALEKSTNLLDELLFDQFVVLGQEYTRKVIYQVAENQAVQVLQPTELGEKTEVDDGAG